MLRRKSSRRHQRGDYHAQQPRRVRSLAKVAIVVTSLMLCAMALVDSGQAAERPKLFGTNEVRSTDISAFNKWTDVLLRHNEEIDWVDEDCVRGQEAACRMRAWVDYLATLKGLSPRSQMEAVHRYVNDETYVSDVFNYGREDYWATPYQFFRNAGDCEDFAIIKYLSLRALGFGPEDLRIVVLQDTTTGRPHAVLAVYEGADAFVLDNRLPAVVLDREIASYVPYYSLNETAWWLHGDQIPANQHTPAAN